MTFFGKASKHQTTKSRRHPLIATAIGGAVVIAVVSGGSMTAFAHSDSGDTKTSASVSAQKTSGNWHKSGDWKRWVNKSDGSHGREYWQKHRWNHSKPTTPTTPTAEPTAPVTEPTTPPVTTPVSEPVSEPATPPVTTPDTTPVTAPPVEPATPPVTAPPAEPAAPAVPAPPAEPATAPTTGTLPTAATTGYPAGTALKPTGGLTVTTDGAVFDGMQFNGDVVIKANNVTIKNSLVNGRIQMRAPFAGLLVQRTEISGPGANYTQSSKSPGIGYDNFTADGVNIHGWGDGAMFDSNVTIKNSWIHDIPVVPGSHNQAILSLGGPNFTIVNNRLDAGNQGNFTAALSFLNQWNSFSNALVQGNLFNGGGYCVYAGGEDKGNAARPSSNVRFIDNTFGTEKNPKCGFYGAATAFDERGAGNVWSGNAMTNGSTVSAP
jgi:outer membrane biosynthesis protein TonB